MSHSDDMADESDDGHSSNSKNQQQRLCKPSRFVSKVQSKPLAILKYTVQQQYTMTKKQCERLSSAEREKEVLTSVRVMGFSTNEHEIYVVAKDLCLCIHTRKGNVAKSVGQFDDSEKVLMKVVCPRSNGRMSTHSLLALTFKGVKRLLTKSRSARSEEVLKWITTEVGKLFSNPPTNSIPSDVFFSAEKDYQESKVQENVYMNNSQMAYPQNVPMSQTQQHVSTPRPIDPIHQMYQSSMNEQQERVISPQMVSNPTEQQQQFIQQQQHFYQVNMMKNGNKANVSNMNNMSNMKYMTNMNNMSNMKYMTNMNNMNNMNNMPSLIHPQVAYVTPISQGQYVQMMPVTKFHAARSNNTDKKSTPPMMAASMYPYPYYQVNPVMHKMAYQGNIFSNSMNNQTFAVNALSNLATGSRYEQADMA